MTSDSKENKDGSPSISNWGDKLRMSILTDIYEREGLTGIEKYCFFLLSTAKEEAKVQERLRAVEILHKYAMKSAGIEGLDLIEAAQKEILNQHD